MGQNVVQKIGKYEIISELGQGGMGTVYKARDPLISRLVALKTVNPELVSNPEILQRFYREAQSIGALQHPNIVTVFDLGEFEGHPYIAMEFVEGESLQSLIARQAPLPLAAKLKLAEQICLGLDHAHKNGIVHRDIKPGNILVKNDGTPKIVDFGIVHLETTTLTKTGMFMGTIQYASPEQLNEGRVDQRSDLWSVVCVIYELIAYRKPFEGSNFGAILGKILTAEPEPLSRLCPGVPVELDAIITKGLKKNLAERYQSLDELMVDLVPLSQTLQRSLVGDLLVEARHLKEQGDLVNAQGKLRAILILDKTQGEAKHLNAEIAAELDRLSSSPKVREMFSAGEEAFKRGEFAEAIRALSEILKLNPNDTQARNLKEQAAREQDRQRQVREALTAGQQALKQGDLTGAEQELKKVLALDQNNSQASTLLTEIRKDRSGREKDFGLKEGLWKADNLVSAGKYNEAQVELAALQKAFPDAQEVRQKLQEVNSRLTPPLAAGGLPGAGSASDQAKWRESQLAEATKSLAGDDIPGATLLLSSVKDRFPADPKVEALLQQLEQKKAGTPAQPIKPAPPLAVGTDKPRRSLGLGMILGGIALAVALGIGAFLHYHHAPSSAGTAASPEEIQLEHDAKLLQDNGNRDAALAKWRDLAARKGTLQSEAQQAIQQMTHQQEIESQEASLFSQGMAAQQDKKWDDAVTAYQKVADLNGPMKDQALQAISSVKELQSGADASTLEKEKYDHAVAALAQQDYAQARILFQQVVDLKVPDSKYAAKAQTQLKDVTAAGQSKQEFEAGVKAQGSGDVSGALARFQDIAAKPGPFQAQAQSRIQQINQVQAANNQKQQMERALQENLKKFHDLESQKKYGDAAALLPSISQTGGDGNQLKNELESAEQSDLQNLTSKFSQAKNNKDVATLQLLRGQFQSLASASGTPAAQARDYAENQIPATITQINQANQPKSQPSSAPANPVASLIVSGTYRPWTRSVQKGMLVPEYNVVGGLKPLDLRMSPVQGAASGSFVTVKINIDENGNVSPDIVLYDPSGVGPAVMDAAKKWKFAPPMVKGTLVKTSVTVKVTF
ncbi:MAG: TonB family protein [Acidobacteriota bacterium]|nr:TonB family protein [Acidobacteriota bacterium]